LALAGHRVHATDPNPAAIERARWEDGGGYRPQQCLVRQATDGWRTDVWVMAYRALLRADLDDALRAAGLVAVRWLDPEVSGDDRLVVAACRP